ncbi:MAG: tetratricopeptide repeat protein [Candidatus Thorarchaeota archaeon]|nr:MAG: tetratricopeptide repeat protein [Candidatus Thorarchaeota archaeon]
MQSIEKIQKKVQERGDRLRIGVLKGRCFIGLGEFSEALKATQAVVEEGKRSEENRISVIDALLVKADALLRLAQVDRSFEACEQAERLRKELPADNESLLESIRAKILHVKSTGFYYRDDVQKGIECARQSLSLRERLGDVSGVVESLMKVAYLHLEVDSDQSLEYMERALELNRELGKKSHIIAALGWKGLIQSSKGNWDEAERFILEAIDLAREHDMGGRVQANLLILALMCQRKGDFVRAEKLYQECITASERVGQSLFVAMCSNNLGEMYRAQGKLDEALAGYKKSMEINREIDRMKGYVWGLGNCGLIQYARGNLDAALGFLEEALRIAKERTEAGLLMKYVEWGALYVVMVLVDRGMIKKAQMHVEDLRQFAEKEESEITNQIYKTAASIVLKSSSLAQDRALAKDYLTEVLGNLYHSEVNSIACLLLCDLLVEDLRLSGDRSLLDELKWRLSSFVETTLDQGSTSLQTEALLLQSKVALLELDMKQASRLLNQARSLSEAKGLIMISKRIVDEHDALLTELSVYEKLGGDELRIPEQIERVRIHEQIGEMIQKGLWRKMLF